MSALGFGQHLMIDGYAVSNEPLSDLELVFKFLDEFPARINMQKIMPPYVFWYDAKESSDSGLSGFVLIAESHISIHTFPEKKFLSIDIFSCQVFNTDQAKMEIHDFFGLTKSEVNRIDRGQEYPRSIRGSLQLVVGQRKVIKH
jgi:S-adenosylmethionine decarboxylase